MKHIYTALFFLSLPFIVFRLFWRGLRTAAYFKRWNERFGYGLTITDPRPVIWIHAVSVGEVEASRPLIQSLQHHYADHQLLITTMTPTGSDRVKRLYADSVAHVYLPYDLPFAVKHFIKTARPAFGIIMETELWPNLLGHCQRKQLPIILANARMSARSARGYLRLASFTRQILRSFTLIAAQTQEDRKRFQQLGADTNNVHAVGNLKFEISLPANLMGQAEALRAIWGKRPVLIAASTHDGEEDIILNASRQIRGHYADLLLILVPRHPERFDRVAALSQKAGFNTIRHSDKSLCSSEVQVLVVDSMGELPLFYASSDIAFVGGSLVATGGHNILEPAALGRAIITGPFYFNFNEITRRFLKAGAAIEVTDSQSLAITVIDLLDNPAKKVEMGALALALITQNQGASKRLLNLIKRHIDNAH